MKPTDHDFDDEDMKDLLHGTTLNEEEERFLGLVQREIAGATTKDERAQMRKLMTKPIYRRMKRELENYAADDFVEASLKVIIGKASPDEITKIRALKASHPARWQKVLRIGHFLQQMGKSPEPPNAEPEPMPESVNNRLLVELKRVRAKRKSGKK